ncbi:MAG: hypothetical protein ACJAZM_001932, partial [Cyclobacteriaceae bacterium]
TKFVEEYFDASKLKKEVTEDEAIATALINILRDNKSAKKDAEPQNPTNSHSNWKNRAKS